MTNSARSKRAFSLKIQNPCKKFKAPIPLARREVEESHYSSDYLDYESRDDHRTSAVAAEYLERGGGGGVGGGYDRGGSELYARDEPPHPHHQRGAERDRLDHQARGAHSDISVDSIERQGGGGGGGGGVPRGTGGGGGGQAVERAQEAWLDELLARRAKIIVQVTYPRTANNDKELTVVRGEYLEVLDDSRKWWKARNSRGQVAHVPHTIVTPHNGAAGSPDNDVFNNQIYAARYPRQSHGYNYEVGALFFEERETIFRSLVECFASNNGIGA